MGSKVEREFLALASAEAAGGRRAVAEATAARAAREKSWSLRVVVVLHSAALGADFSPSLLDAAAALVGRSAACALFGV